ncbi:MAG: YjbQ family protein [Alphaproteobacteria bacterium]|nr:YjbQ family protein [Alphaproteobacteria bacterium]
MTLITVRTPGRGLHDITPLVAREVSGDGLVHLFLQHTSASLVISENADPDVLRDMDDWFTRHVPDGDPAYRHADEGPDDMPSHIRAALTQPSLLVPVRGGRLALGTWQAIYLFEHRTHPHTRRILLTRL